MVMNDIRLDHVESYTKDGTIFIYIKFRFKLHKFKSKRGIKNGSKYFEKVETGEWMSLETKRFWNLLQDYKVLRDYRNTLNSSFKDSYQTRENRKRLLESIVNRKKYLKERLEQERKVDQPFLEHPKVRLHTLF